jgi:4-hydroxy-tetrahydrodipicolinate synthase
MNEAVRLPMVPLTEPTRVAIREAMVHAGILNA